MTPSGPTLRLHFLILLQAICGMLGAQLPGGAPLRDTVDLSVLGIRADSFPQVALHFKAEPRSGRALGQMPGAGIRVRENGALRPLIHLRPLSEFTPLQVALVVDRSSSMLDEFIYRFDTLPDGKLVIQEVAMRQPGDPYAMDLARDGVIRFVNSLQAGKDSMLVVGFAGTVDPVQPLSGDTAVVHARVHSLQADGSTAFYDALRTGLDSLEHHAGLRAVVALTDGVDNASRTSLDSVVRRAQSSGIPLYLIGLGNVDKPVLQRLASESGGAFYHTSRADRLPEIYLRISRKLQAVQELIYLAAEPVSSAEGLRRVQVEWDIDSLFVGELRSSYLLPEAALAGVRARKRRLRGYLAGGMALLAVLLAGLLWWGRGRNETASSSRTVDTLPRTTSVALPVPRAFPNPSAGHVYFAWDDPDQVEVADLVLTNHAGRELRRYSLSGPHSLLELDLSDLAAGTYLYRLHAANAVSEAGRLLIRK